MTAPPDARAKRIFGDALERPEAERESFVAAACGADDALRAQVMGLLRALEAAGDLLASPTIGDDPHDASQDPAPGARPSDDGLHPGARRMEGVGDWIGNFRLIRELGQGGFATVFEAEQTEPVHRRVALKLIRPGMETEQIISRVEIERQALALMDHPNIAHVLEAAATPSGLPYFVMELVEGLPITEYCDRERLTTRDRLGLFLQVCCAVQHAHQKGIIHRDLKPSNVLVTPVDGHPVPKVIDFGIAKATEGSLTTHPVTTQLQLLGTPEYMSPEQAAGSGVDVDTRSDVYALGVLLYELLVGKLPHDTGQLRLVGLEAVLRCIREEEPPGPSTRLTDLDPDSILAARRRRAEPRSLSRLLKGDLDWITLKALEKDRSRRYASVSELAADISRHLRDEPVLASPPSRVYRLRKLVRKHRGKVGAAVAVLVALLAGLAMTTGQYLRAEGALEAEQIQHAETIRQRTEAEAARKLAATERDKAQTELEKATAIVDFLRTMLGAAAPMKRGRDVRVAEVLDIAASTVGADFREHPEVEATLRITLGEAYQDLGLYDEAEPHLRRAIEIYSSLLGDEADATLQARSSLASLLVDQGQYVEAEAISRSLYETRRSQAGEEHPATVFAKEALAIALVHLERLEEAEPLLRGALDWLNRTYGEEDAGATKATHELAVLLHCKGDLASAEELLRRVLASQERSLGTDDERTLLTMDSLGDVVGSAGRPVEAVEIHRRTLAIRRRVYGEEHPETLRTLLRLANSLRRSGELEEAESTQREALESMRLVLGEEHTDTLTGMGNLALLLVELGRPEEAESMTRRVLEVRQRISKESPETLGVQANLGRLLYNHGKAEESISLHEETLEACVRVLGEAHPTTLYVQHGQAHALMAAGRTSEAVALHRESLVAHRRVLGDEHPKTLMAMGCLGALLCGQRDFAGAEPLFREAWAIRREDPSYLDHLFLLNNLFVTVREQGRFAEAEDLCRELMEAERLLHGEVPLYRRTHLSQLLQAQEKYEEAEPILRETLQLTRSRYPKNSPKLGTPLVLLGQNQLRQEDFVEAEVLLRECLAIREKILPPTDWRIPNTESLLGAALLGQGRYGEAEPLLLSGYEDMAPPETLAFRKAEALQRLVELYDSWEVADPGKGHADRAAEYRALLETLED